MKAYYVFWIKSEVAQHYFYKGDILYRFLKLYQQDQNKYDLSIQFDYVTNNISRHDLFSYFKKINLPNVYIGEKGNTIELYTKEQYITLHIHEKHLLFYCDTIYDAENLLFPILRNFHPLLFIMCIHTDDYGWISPVKNEQALKHNMELYS